ncbi:MAG: sensor histidine kinase [Marinifilaceae bacterium]
MTQRIRLILVLVVVSVMGILLLQWYWISNSYSVNREQLLKELNLALEKSVKQEMNTRLSKVTNLVYRDKNTAVLSYSDSVQDGFLDSLLRERKKNQKEGESAQVLFSFSTGVSEVKAINSDSIPENLQFKLKEIISSMLYQEAKGNMHVDLMLLDSFLTRELEDRDMLANHYLEVLNQKTDSVMKASWENHQDTINSLASRPVKVSLLEEEYVRARIPHQQQFILQRMVMGLGGSLLLLVIVFGCFSFMLITIFRQKRLSEIKNDFINNMTHELKTPIATVSAAVEAMQHFGVLEDARKTESYLNLSSRELQRLSGLVEKVLNIANHEKKKLDLTPETIDLRELCQNIFNGQQLRNGKREVKFHYEADEGTDRINADRFHFSNVMQNLVENAVKYSGDQVEVWVACKQKGAVTEISVTDNGFGIPKRHQARIFDKFYRVPTGNVHNVKGFGLGLHYVKTILLEHGGDIRVKSTPHKGSCFTISLP